MQSNIELIKQFYSERSANKIKEKTRELDNLLLHRLSEFLHKPFRETTKEDIIGFFNSMQGKHEMQTISLFKTTVKRFYNWLYDLERRQHPDCLCIIYNNLLAMEDFNKTIEKLVEEEKNE